MVIGRGVESSHSTHQLFSELVLTVVTPHRCAECRSRGIREPSGGETAVERGGAALEGLVVSGPDSLPACPKFGGSFDTTVTKLHGTL